MARNCPKKDWTKQKAVATIEGKTTEPTPAQNDWLLQNPLRDGCAHQEYYKDSHGRLRQKFTSGGKEISREVKKATAIRTVKLVARTGEVRTASQFPASHVFYCYPCMSEFKVKESDCGKGDRKVRCEYCEGRSFCYYRTEDGQGKQWQRGMVKNGGSDQE